MYTFFSGYAAEWGGIDSDGADYLNRIWSHKWGFRNVWRSSAGNVHVARYHINPSLWHRTGSTRTRIGVIAHEQGKCYSFRIRLSSSLLLAAGKGTCFVTFIYSHFKSQPLRNCITTPIQGISLACPIDMTSMAVARVCHIYDMML